LSKLLIIDLSLSFFAAIKDEASWVQTISSQIQIAKKKPKKKNPTHLTPTGN